MALKFEKIDDFWKNEKAIDSFFSIRIKKYKFCEMFRCIKGIDTQHFISLVKSRIHEIYIPSKNISIDESMCFHTSKFNANHQYLKKKAISNGVRHRSAADENLLLLNFNIHYCSSVLPKEPPLYQQQDHSYYRKEQAPTYHANDQVNDLVFPYTRRNLYFDRYFSSKDTIKQQEKKGNNITTITSKQREEEFNKLKPAQKNDYKWKRNQSNVIENLYMINKRVQKKAVRKKIKIFGYCAHSVIKIDSKKESVKMITDPFNHMNKFKPKV
jgi:hypothetical protein